MDIHTHLAQLILEKMARRIPHQSERTIPTRTSSTSFDILRNAAAGSHRTLSRLNKTTWTVGTRKNCRPLRSLRYIEAYEWTNNNTSI
ncbi:hypothetical protein Aduo_018743 [Ancylostoma duodenale]